MTGKGYEGVETGKQFGFGSLFDILRDHFVDGPSVDGLHDLVTQLTGMVQALVEEIDDREFSQGHAYETLAYATLAVFVLKEFERFNDSEYSTRRAELAEVWNQLMAKLKAKGIEATIPFPG